ncbi:MAG: hypothetical protein SGARI_005686, partial [Bacillariaceae sp.]
MPPIPQRIHTVNLGSPLFGQKRSTNVKSLLKEAIHISLDDDATVSTAASTAVSSETKVSFDTSQNIEIPSNEEHALTDEVIATCWWHEDERRSFKANKDSALQACSVSEKESWTEALRTLFDFCNHAPLHFTWTEEDLQAKASTMQGTELRGVESDGAPALSGMRKKHAANVLTYTARVPKRLPQDLRDRMISARSLQFSRPHLLFAQAMAQVDRNAVLEM